MVQICVAVKSNLLQPVYHYQSDSAGLQVTFSKIIEPIYFRRFLEYLRVRRMSVGTQ